MQGIEPTSTKLLTRVASRNDIRSYFAYFQALKIFSAPFTPAIKGLKVLDIKCDPPDAELYRTALQVERPVEVRSSWDSGGVS